MISKSFLQCLIWSFERIPSQFDAKCVSFHHVAAQADNHLHFFVDGWPAPLVKPMGAKFSTYTGVIDCIPLCVISAMIALISGLRELISIQTLNRCINGPHPRCIPHFIVGICSRLTNQSSALGGNSVEMNHVRGFRAKKR